MIEKKDAKPPTFGEQLRQWRIAKKLSMGEVSRALGITTVYYSDVENDRKVPFPLNGTDLYRRLADVLGVSRASLEGAALEARRHRVELNLERASDGARGIALHFARLVSDGELTEEQAKDIEKVLGGNKP